MTDQPKVSERMEALLLEVVLDVHAHEQNRNRYTFADCEESRSALLSAIAEIEQRAEKAEQERDKWREVAVAIHNVCLDVSRPPASENFPAAVLRMRAAMAALGPLWDEAVK